MALISMHVSRHRDEEDDPPKDELGRYLEVDELSDEPSQEEETLYGTSPPCTPRQIKRMSGKHHRSQGRAGGRSPNKGEPDAEYSKQNKREPWTTSQCREGVCVCVFWRAGGLVF